MLGELGLERSIWAIFGEFLALFADVFYLTGLIDFLPDFGERFWLFEPYKLFLFAISLYEVANLLLIIIPAYYSLFLSSYGFEI